MSMPKHGPQMQLNKRRSKEIHNRSTRQTKRDRIRQKRPLIMLCESMLMMPIRKRPFLLFINKESRRITNRVNCMPFHPNWPKNRHPDHQPRTCRNPSLMRQHLDPLRGRSQLFESIWCFMKSPNSLDRRVDVRRNAKYWHCC